MRDGTAYHVERNLQAAATNDGLSREANYGPERSGDIKHSLADISKAEAAFGYKPVVHFEEGLKKTVEWYRSEMKSA